MSRRQKSIVLTEPCPGSKSPARGVGGEIIESIELIRKFSPTRHGHMVDAKLIQSRQIKPGKSQTKIHTVTYEDPKQFSQLKSECNRDNDYQIKRVKNLRPGRRPCNTDENLTFELNNQPKNLPAGMGATQTSTPNNQQPYTPVQSSACQPKPSYPPTPVTNQTCQRSQNYDYRQTSNFSGPSNQRQAGMAYAKQSFPIPQTRATTTIMNPCASQRNNVRNTICPSSAPEPCQRNAVSTRRNATFPLLVPDLNSFRRNYASTRVGTPCTPPSVPRNDVCNRRNSPCPQPAPDPGSSRRNDTPTQINTSCRLPGSGTRTPSNDPRNDVCNQRIQNPESDNCDYNEFEAEMFEECEEESEDECNEDFEEECEDEEEKCPSDCVDDEKEKAELFRDLCNWMGKQCPASPDSLEEKDSDSVNFNVDLSNLIEVNKLLLGGVKDLSVEIPEKDESHITAFFDLEKPGISLDEDPKNILDQIDTLFKATGRKLDVTTFSSTSPDSIAPKIIPVNKLNFVDPIRLDEAEIILKSTDEPAPDMQDVTTEIEKFDTTFEMQRLIKGDNDKSYNCVLELQPFRVETFFQLRGSNQPSWFPGMFTAYPDSESSVRSIKSPSLLIKQAWQFMKPE